MKRNATTSRFLFALGAVLVVSSVLPATAQPGTQAPSAALPEDLVFGEEIDVRIVNLEVVVEKGNGERVRGLGRQDFRVLVDGQEVDVDYFTEVSMGRVRSGENGETPPAVEAGEVVKTNYVLFVDDDHTQVTLRRPVLRGLADRLAGLGVEDRVAVVVQSGNRLELLSPFTTDREATLAALEELDDGDRFGGVLRSGRFHRDFTGGPGGAAGYFQAGGPLGSEESRAAAADLFFRGGGAVFRRDDDGGASPYPSHDVVAEGLGAAGNVVASGLVFEGMRPNSFEQEARASILERDLSLSVNAVVATMRALDPPEGRKVLLLLAGFWPTGEFRPYGRGAGLRTDLETLDGLTNTANLLGYTVYPMDQQVGAPNTRLWQNLRYVARDTGGRAFMAGSNVTALDYVSDDTSNYYWLGFVPEYRRDDRVHDIEVDVLRPGVQVRARRGYVDLSRIAEADMEAQRVLLFPSQSERATAVLKVSVGASKSLRGRMMSVPIDIDVPVGMFAALPYGERFLQRLEVRFATIDGDGWRAEQPAMPLELWSDAAPEPDAVFQYHAEVTMRHLPHSVVVTVHDQVSRQTSNARVEVVP